MKKNIFAKTRLDDDDDDELEEERGLTELNDIVEQKLLENRQIFLWGPVEDDSSRDVVSKLLYLETLNPGEPITLFISSPGGVVTSGMAIIDTMNLISSPVTTVCMGLAASMGSLILSAGEKGKRFIYPYGRVMIHQPSVGGVYGQASDLEIQAREIVKTKEVSAEILAKNCGKSKDKVLKDLDRDYWMDSKESIEYGIVDGIYEFPKAK